MIGRRAQRVRNGDYRDITGGLARLLEDALEHW